MNKERKQALLALLLLVPAPTIGTLAGVSLDSLRGTVLGQSLYFFSKIWILILPLIWLKWVDKQPFSLSPVRKGGLGIGLLSGLVIGLGIYGGWLLVGQHWVDQGFFREQVEKNGLNTPARYLFLCAYLALVNSLLEEYVWRWFVYRKCEVLLKSSAPAVLLSGLFFTLHHVFALNTYFDWRVTLLASVGVFTGGVIWSWCYGRYRSVWPGYLSHIIADVAIFIIGWLMIFP